MSRKGHDDDDDDDDDDDEEEEDDDDDDDENAPDVFQLLVLLHQMPDSAEALMTPGKINACKIKDCGPLSPCAEEEW